VGLRLDLFSKNLFVSNIPRNPLAWLLLRLLGKGEAFERFTISQILFKISNASPLLNLYIITAQNQFRSGFWVFAVEGGSVGKIIDGWSPVKVLRKATILFVSSLESVNPS